MGTPGLTFPRTPTPSLASCRVAHLSDQPPSLRTEAYPDQILDKLDFCVGYGNHHAHVLVLLGDVCHIKTPSRTSHRLVQAAAEVPNPRRLGRRPRPARPHRRHRHRPRPGRVCHRRGAGHACVLADLADLLPTTDFAELDVLVASPPCQAWSQAGRRDGEHDVTRCHRLTDRVAAGTTGRTVRCSATRGRRWSVNRSAWPGTCNRTASRWRCLRCSDCGATSSAS